MTTVMTIMNSRDMWTMLLVTIIAGVYYIHTYIHTCIHITCYYIHTYIHTHYILLHVDSKQC